MDRKRAQEGKFTAEATSPTSSTKAHVQSRIHI